ncbi:hypothetical protein Y032_0432g1344 [Ancylostoma ceylanicum]|uniref:Uncharacterized protein n=1 Tax=Ancylostoma ceylanicum TaxID=53326 RepID=A0A016X046_9BILA|nr:hypothetical protein Y032_0432g1344 [Ancylostoma ceylanicum]
MDDDLVDVLIVLGVLMLGVIGLLVLLAMHAKRFRRLFRCFKNEEDTPIKVKRTTIKNKSKHCTQKGYFLHHYPSTDIFPAPVRQKSFSSSCPNRQHIRQKWLTVWSQLIRATQQAAHISQAKYMQCRSDVVQHETLLLIGFKVI